MNTIKLTRLERKFTNNAATFANPATAFTPIQDNRASVTDISFTGLSISGTIPNPVTGQVGILQSSPLTTGGNLGKGTDNQSYYFTAIYDDNLLGTGAVAGIARGSAWYLMLRATVDVTYDIPGAGRRRRRQGRQRKEMTGQIVSCSFLWLRKPNDRNSPSYMDRNIWSAASTQPISRSSYTVHHVVCLTHCSRVRSRLAEPGRGPSSLSRRPFSRPRRRRLPPAQPRARPRPSPSCSRSCRRCSWHRLLSIPLH